MKKVIGLLSAVALAFGVFLAANTASPENNSELSLSSMTRLITADASCNTGQGQKPIYSYRWVVCGYEGGGDEGDSATPVYCTKRVIVGYGDYTNNGYCEDGSNCYSGEGNASNGTYDCYAG